LSQLFKYDPLQLGHKILNGGKFVFLVKNL